ncbi:MAG: chemotaxis response regulator protein-glutamate methylesterase [Phormidesmis sp.]
MTSSRSNVRRIRVAIANDTLIALEALRRVIATDPNYELIWTAKDGAQAVEKCQRDRPDLILMDLLMPQLDGVEATRQIMAQSPCAILIVTASVDRNTSKVFEAMGHGALDVITTPILGLASRQPAPEAARPLLAKMATLRTLISQPTTANVPLGHRLSQPPSTPKLIILGASTGGPKALAKILAQIPSKSTAAVMFVQHIDPQFAAGLATWLNSQTQVPVVLAKAGDAPQPGKVLMAQAKHHLIMQGDRTLAYTPTDAGIPYTPSVDVFFKSVAAHWPSPGTAILLTGMGRDGAAGLHTLRNAGWHTIAESQQSCVVYGMPRAAIESGAACSVLSVEAIATGFPEKFTQTYHHTRQA